MIEIERVPSGRFNEAYAIVLEYYEAVSVVVREDPVQFVREYFGPGAGIWLARDGPAISGCIALRRVPYLDRSAEVKRLYVRPELRGQGIADRLLEELESYARTQGYLTLYLDTKADMVAALRFYSRHRFEACDRYNDNPQAEIFLRKQL